MSSKGWMNQDVKRISRTFDAPTDDRQDVKDTTRSFAKVLDRKVHRKEKKKLNKLKKQAFAKRQKVTDYIASQEPQRKKKLKNKRKTKKKIGKDGTADSGTEDQSDLYASQPSTSQEYEKFLEEAALERRREQRRLIQEEDKAVRRYSKKLGLNKRKSKAAPQSFVADGLAYLLEVCDSEGLRDSVAAAGSDADDSDEERNAQKRRKRAKMNEFDDDAQSENDEEFSDDSAEADGFSDSDEIDADDALDSKPKLKDGKKKSVTFNSAVSRSDGTQDNLESESLMDGMESSAGPAPPTLKQDIYGRSLDADGNVVRSMDSNKKRGREEDTLDDDQRKRLTKMINGIINRLSETNLHSSVAQIDSMYKTNSRHDMKVVLTEVLFRACLRYQKLPKRLMLEHALFVALLYSSVSADIGAHVIEALVNKYDEWKDVSLAAAEEDKRLDNVLVFLCHLVDFKVIHPVLLFDILKEFVMSFDQKNVENILLILETAGFTLRKEDPLALRDIISLVQTKAVSPEAEDIRNNSRTRFMLDILMAVKNNNVAKVTQFDAETVQHFQKVRRGLLHGPSEAVLRITLADLRNASTSGRWWVVGSSWDPNSASIMERADKPQENEIADESTESDAVMTQPKKEDFSAELLALARKQRMNTDTRRTIFCIIMCADDYLDGFEKLLKLGYKGTVEREIIHICVDCSMNEPVFNPYYVFLIQKFCEFHNRFQLTTQFALWDKMKQLSNFKMGARRVFAKCVSKLIELRAVPVSVLKCLEFGALDKPTIAFLKRVLTQLLQFLSDDALCDLFGATPKPKLRPFYDGLRFFLAQYLEQAGDEPQAEDEGRGHTGGKSTEGKLSQRVLLVKKIMYLAGEQAANPAKKPRRSEVGDEW